MPLTCRSLPRACIAFLLAASLPAQTTWIVDGAGGTGVHFTDLPAAVAAASPGDVIELRGATRPYHAASISRGLTILGSNGPVLHGVLKVVGLPAGETVAIRGLEVREPGTAILQCGIWLQDCAGAVLLHRVTLGAPTLGPELFAGLVVDRCRLAQLSLVEVFALHRVTVRDSTVVMAQCQLHGALSDNSWRQYCTLDCAQSQVQLQDSTVDGDGWRMVLSPFQVYYLGNPAIGLDATELVLAGQTVVRGGYVANPGVYACAGVVSMSFAMRPAHVRSFASVFVNSVYPWCLKELPPERPALDLRSTGQPGALSCRLDLQGEPQSPVLLAMGPALSPPLATFAGELFLAIPSAVVLAVGVSDVAGAFTTSFPLPPQLPSGWQFGVQAVVPWSSGSLRLSNVRIGWIGAD